MRRSKIITTVILLLMVASLLVGCGSNNKFLEDKESWSNAKFVEKVAKSISNRQDSAWLFYAGDNYNYNLTSEGVLQPYFRMKSFKATEDEQNPELIHYSCKIPGVVGTCFNMAFDTYFSKNTKYCAWVDMEGSVRLHRDANGNRQIDISQGDNAFAVYASLRYPDTTILVLRGLDISGGISGDNINDIIPALLAYASETYAEALGVDTETYVKETVLPEYKDYSDNLDKIARSAKKSGSGFIARLRSLPDLVLYLVVMVGFVIIGRIFSLLGALAGIVKDKLSYRFDAMRSRAQEKRQKKNKKIVIKSNKIKGKSLAKRQKLSNIVYNNENTSYSDELRKPITWFLIKGGNQEIMSLLCSKIHKGSRLVDSNQDDITLAGWSAAALGRIVTEKMKPEDIKRNMQSLEPAIDRYNLYLESYNALNDEYNAARQRYIAAFENYVKADAASSDSLSFKSEMNDAEKEYGKLEYEMKELATELNKGLGGFMLKDGNLPFAYLIFILKDNQSDIHRFIKQGAIMGLIDWLNENRNHPDAKEFFDLVVHTRAEMISSDNELSFFEVRVPDECTTEEYAIILENVLHCANPSIKYCDTTKLMKIATEAVPDCMDMLVACPLRLIDPANRTTLGFYHFNPYVHAMWTRYQPPLHTGTVIKRYHEVDDRTKPLSSGLHLSLFRDPYAVIPTLFHEFQHFNGDPNEASVFLKTQMFSIKFYKKYRDADARNDGVFAQLTALLGMPPGADKTDKLNDIIERYYGKCITEEEAEVHADQEIAKLNIIVDMANAQETWDRDIKYPYLDDENDSYNRDLIRRIIIRYDTVPKSITKQEFEAIISGEETVAREVKEAVGLKVKNKYYGPQPWSFAGNISLDEEELACADFMTRDELPEPDNMESLIAMIKDFKEGKY